MRTLLKLLTLPALALLAAPSSFADLPLAFECSLPSGSILTIPIYAVGYAVTYNPAAGGNSAVVSVAAVLDYTDRLIQAQATQSSLGSCYVQIGGANIALTNTTVSDLSTELYAAGLGQPAFIEATLSAATITVDGIPVTLKKPTPETAERLGAESRARLEAKLKQQ